MTSAQFFPHYRDHVAEHVVHRYHHRPFSSMSIRSVFCCRNGFGAFPFSAKLSGAGGPKCTVGASYLHVREGRSVGTA